MKNQKQLLKKLLLPGIIGSVLIFIFVSIVGGALLDPKPKDLPVAVVAPPMIVKQMDGALAQKAPGVFAIKAYQNPAEAKKDLQKQAVYGVVELTPKGVDVSVSSAIGAAPTEAISKAFGGIAQATGQKLSITDVTPKASKMSTILVIMFLFIITTIAGIVSQSVLGKEATENFKLWLAATALASVMIGLSGAITALLVEVLDEVFLGVGIALAVSAFASSAIVAACKAIFGERGAALAAVLLVPLGLVTASVVVNYRFLPDFYQTIAPFMPSFATIDAIRQVTYLDGATIITPYMVLGAWIAGALAVIGLVARMKRGAK